jgi:hypothetical protein
MLSEHLFNCYFLASCAETEQAGLLQERSGNDLQSFVGARTVRNGAQEEEEHIICMTEISSEASSGERSAGRGFGSVLASSKVRLS